MPKYILPVAIALAAVVAIAVGSGVLDDDTMPDIVALGGAFVAPEPGFRVVPPEIVGYPEGEVASDPATEQPESESDLGGGGTTAPTGPPDAGAQPTAGATAGAEVPGGGASAFPPLAAGDGQGGVIAPPAALDPPGVPAGAGPVGPSAPPDPLPTSAPRPIIEPTPDPTPSPTPPATAPPTIPPTSPPATPPPTTPPTPTGSPWATCPWPARDRLPGLDLADRDAFTDASGARVTVARNAGETADGPFDMVLRVVDSTHALAAGQEWLTDARSPFPAAAGAAVLRGNPGNQAGGFRVVIDVSFHRAGAVQSGSAAPWSGSRVGVTSAMVVFGLDSTGNAGNELFGIDDRAGVGLSPNTDIEAAASPDPTVRVWGTSSGSGRPDDVDDAVLVVLDTATNPSAQPLRMTFERTGNVGRDIVLGGLMPPLDMGSWSCR